MEFWTEVRRRVLTNELSRRAACREYKLSWHTLKKILAHDQPPGYRQRHRRKKPKLEEFLPIIHQILEDDRSAPKKQRLPTVLSHAEVRAILAHVKNPIHRTCLFAAIRQASQGSTA